MTKATITKRDKAELELTVVVTKAELASAKQAVLEQMKKGLKVPGFRPGKAPDDIAERHVDQAKFQLEVVEKVLAATYSEAIKGHEIRALAEPKVDVTKFVPFDEMEYTAKIAVVPTIDFDYKKLKVKYDAPKVTDKEVDEALKELQRQAAEPITVDRAAKQGDEVRFDFEGVREGSPVEGAAGQNTLLELGSGKFIPGYEDELIGMKKGDEKTFDITFPKEYHAEDLAGKVVTFTAKVHEVREKNLPKLDDSFAKTVAQMDSLQALKDDVRKNLVAGKDDDYKKEYENAVLEEAMKQIKLEVSPMLEHDQAHELEHQYEHQIASSGMKLEDWLKVQGKDEKSFHDELHVEARRRISIGLIIRDIIEKQKFNVTVDEVQDNLEKMRMSYSDPQILKQLDADEFKNDLANRMVTQKAVDWLCEQAKS
ncbi:MAG: trigger factor [Candidatus Saccharibacteria bacterium]|jgi:trigger factor